MIAPEWLLEPGSLQLYNTNDVYLPNAGREMGQQPGGPPSRLGNRRTRTEQGDEIEIRVADERAFGVSRKPLREELLKRLREFRGRLPADFKFDWDEANVR